MEDDYKNLDNEYEDLILNHLMKTYFQTNSPANIQIESYNFFVNHKLKEIIECECPIDIPLDNGSIFRFSFTNTIFKNPYIVSDDNQIQYITPMDCRIKDLSYSGTLISDVTSCIIESERGEIKELKTEKRKVLCRIPVMLLSSSCNLSNKSEKERMEKGESCHDFGGYFICKGKERVLVSTERMNHNEVYVFKKNNLHTKYDISCEIRSMSEETKHSIYIQLKLNQEKVFLSIPYLSNDVPLAYVFLAFGFSIKEIENVMGKILPEKEFGEYRENIILHLVQIAGQENAINYLAQYSTSLISKENKGKYILQLLNNELFPHFGLLTSKYTKVVFLLRMMRKMLLTKNGRREYDEKDNFSNKRLEVSGNLISDLFKTLYKRFLKTIVLQLQKRPDIQVLLNKINVLTLSLYSCFATGNWGIQKSYVRQGVSQILSRLTIGSYLSHLRRIQLPNCKEGKNIKIRLIHPSQIGFECPSESPEGQQCGSVKNLTQFTRVSRGFKTPLVKEILESFPNQNFQADFDKFFEEGDKSKDYTFIFINGTLYSYIFYDETENVLKYLTKLRNLNILFNDISISYRSIEREIHIFSDEGRMLRPIILRESCPSFTELHEKTFDQLRDEKKIVYLDSYELQCHVIAMKYSDYIKDKFYTALELHPSVITSLAVHLLPYADHTQAPRVSYHNAMGKQAIGFPFSNLNYRTDTTTHIMSYPEKPVVQSKYSEYNHCDTMSFGSNLVVAIMMYTGFNQEDSVIMNQSAIDRGLLRCFSYKTITIEEKRKSTISSEKIEYVDESIQNKSYNYKKLDKKTGIVKVGQYVGPLDVVVSKIQKILNKNCSDNNSMNDTQNQIIYKDASVFIKPGEEGFVDKVYITNNSDGVKIVKIKLRKEKIPEIGDKVASRCSQKGTIAIILPEKSMPYSQSGIVPDLIISPLAFISRMTLNQLLESFISKSSLNSLKKYHSTAFSHFSKNILEKIIQEDIDLDVNLKEYGNEVFYNGFTGQKLESKIFLGNVFYHRLKHLVSNKMHSRSTGNINVLTRQPLEGRSRDGGLRCGEMEKDTIVSHGCSRLLRERLFNVSDEYYIYCCSNCGGINPNQPSVGCNVCSSNKIKMIPLPYATKLLFQQLEALGMKINIFPKVD